MGVWVLLHLLSLLGRRKKLALAKILLVLHLLLIRVAVKIGICYIPARFLSIEYSNKRCYICMLKVNKLVTQRTFHAVKVIRNGVGSGVGGHYFVVDSKYLVVKHY